MPCIATYPKLRRFRKIIVAERKKGTLAVKLHAMSSRISMVQT